MFRGDVVRPSHEGGLLISFTGSSPALGSTIETESGIRLGKVDTVLGSIHNPWVHIYPLSKGLDIVDVLGQSTIISSKKNSQKSKPRREDRRQNFSRNNLRNEKKNFNYNDWICPKCGNDNFSWRERCNKCDTPKEGGRSTSRPRRDSGRSERKREWGRGRTQSDRKGRDRGNSERKREWGRGRTQSDRKGRDGPKKNNSNEKRDRSPKRLRGKSRSHFKNRELDDIFKRRE